MLDIFVLSALLIAVAALINHFRRRRPAAGRSDNNSTHQYHAVAIAKNATACPAAALLIGRRFLSREAPPLPVAGCSTYPCRCRYLHYADRRADDRRFPFGVRKSSEPGAGDVERRRSDRRKSAEFILT